MKKIILALLLPLVGLCADFQVKGYDDLDKNDSVVTNVSFDGLLATNWPSTGTVFSATSAVTVTGPQSNAIATAVQPAALSNAINAVTLDDALRVIQPDTNAWVNVTNNTPVFSTMHTSITVTVSNAITATAGSVGTWTNIGNGVWRQGVAGHYTYLSQEVGGSRWNLSPPTMPFDPNLEAWGGTFPYLPANMINLYGTTNSFVYSGSTPIQVTTAPYTSYVGIVTNGGATVNGEAISNGAAITVTAALPPYVLTNAAAFVMTNTLVFNVTDFGAKGDGVTDDTAAIQSAIYAAQNATNQDAGRIRGGGTVYFPTANPYYLIGGSLVFTSLLNGTYYQTPIRLTGTGGSFIQAGTPNYSAGACLFFNPGADYHALIDTRATGTLEVDHLSLVENGNRAVPFIFTSSTIINVHDCYFYGMGSAQYWPTVFVLGGTDNTQGVGTNSAFSGYGTIINNNYGYNVGTFVRGGVFANAVNILNNTVQFAGFVEAAFEFTGLDAGNNSDAGCNIQNNLVEMGLYHLGDYRGPKYGVKLTNCQGFNLSGNTYWDAFSTNNVCGVLLSSGCSGNKINDVAFTGTYTARDFPCVVDNSGMQNTIIGTTSNGAALKTYISTGDLYAKNVNVATNIVASGTITASNGFFVGATPVLTNLPSYVLTNNNASLVTLGTNLTVLGRLGVGVTPSTKLTVGGLGSPLPSPGTASGSFAYLGDTGLYGMFAGITATTGCSWWQSMRSDGNTNTYPLAFNPQGGNVGIGVGAPAATLDVQALGDVDSDVLRLTTKPVSTLKKGAVVIKMFSAVGDATVNTYNSGKVYSKFDGNDYSLARITLATPTGNDTWTDALTVKNGNVFVPGTLTATGGAYWGANPVLTNIPSYYLTNGGPVAVAALAAITNNNASPATLLSSLTVSNSFKSATNTPANNEYMTASDVDQRIASAVPAGFVWYGSAVQAPAPYTSYLLFTNSPVSAWTNSFTLTNGVESLVGARVWTGAVTVLAAGTYQHHVDANYSVVNPTAGTVSYRSDIGITDGTNFVVVIAGSSAQIGTGVDEIDSSGTITTNVAVTPGWKVAVRRLSTFTRTAGSGTATLNIYGGNNHATSPTVRNTRLEGPQAALNAVLFDAPSDGKPYVRMNGGWHDDAAMDATNSANITTNVILYTPPGPVSMGAAGATLNLAATPTVQYYDASGADVTINPMAYVAGREQLVVLNLWSANRNVSWNAAFSNAPASVPQNKTNQYIIGYVYGNPYPSITAAP